MNTTTSPGVVAILRSALGRALQWRLWLLFAAASLLCALLAALPAWNWLASVLNHSVHATAIAEGTAPGLLLDALLSPSTPCGASRDINASNSSVGALPAAMASASTE